MRIDKVNLANAFAAIDDYWSPKIGADINDSQLKLVKLNGTFDWHHHDHEDELFLVVKGTLRMKLGAEDGGDIIVDAGEYVTIPRGVKHCPEAVTTEVEVLLLEPKSTLNTGNVVTARTRKTLERL